MINPTVPTKAPTGTVTPRAPPVFPVCVGPGIELPDVCDPPDSEFAFEGGTDPVGFALPVSASAAPLGGALEGLRKPDTFGDTAGAEPAEVALGWVPAGEVVPMEAGLVAAFKRAVPVSQVTEPLQPSPGAGVPSHVHAEVCS